MRKFPRKLIKHRRPKPNEVADPETPGLEPEFKQANKGPVRHLHRDDPAGANDKGLQALYEVFKYIQGRAADLIYEVNKGIEEFRDGKGTGRYDTAVSNFDTFLADLNDPKPSGSPGARNEFGPTINSADIDPIENDEGFYTSARVIVQWLGGTHSDSSVIHVP